MAYQDYILELFNAEGILVEKIDVLFNPKLGERYEGSCLSQGYLS